MNDRRNGEPLYAAVLIAFLVGLVTLGLLGISALAVAAIGLVFAALGITLLHRGRGARGVPDKYVPSVLRASAAPSTRLAATAISLMNKRLEVIASDILKSCQ
jgi:hypothetical protein